MQSQYNNPFFYINQKITSAFMAIQGSRLNEKYFYFHFLWLQITTNIV